MRRRALGAPAVAAHRVTIALVRALPARRRRRRGAQPAVRIVLTNAYAMGDAAAGAGGKRREASPPSESERGWGPASSEEGQRGSYLAAPVRRELPQNTNSPRSVAVTISMRPSLLTSAAVIALPPPDRL